MVAIKVDLTEKYSDMLLHPKSALLASDLFITNLYKEFTEIYSKKFSDERHAVFKDTVKSIIEHNSDKTKSFKMGINEFTDMTEKEFSAAYLL